MMVMQMNVKKQKEHMLVALLEKYDELGMTTLHIIVDDGNYTDKDVEFCIEWAEKQGEYLSKQIALLLQEFTIKERKIIIEEPWEVKE